MKGVRACVLFHSAFSGARRECRMCWHHLHDTKPASSLSTLPHASRRRASGEVGAEGVKQAGRLEDRQAGREVGREAGG